MADSNTTSSTIDQFQKTSADDESQAHVTRMLLNAPTAESTDSRVRFGLCAEALI
jgi:hypothetical protein